MPQKVTVKKDYHNSRFDRWFKANIIDLPQSLIQKILRLNKIKINRKKVKTSYRVQLGDIVEIYDISKFKISKRPKIIKYKPSRKEVDIYDDYILENNNNFMVINKPRGIAVQAGTKSFRNIIYVLKDSKYFKNTKPYIVHRLDKETSGVFLVSKNRESAQYFTSLFRLRRIHKTYLAIVKGKFPDNIKKMEDNLEYFENNKKTKLRATTFIKVLKSNYKYSFIELIPRTGRKHQLRKQLYMRGFPIIGDIKYNLDKKKYSKQSVMLLHSFKLKFIKKEKKITFEAKLDDDFKKKLKLYFR
jgi:23S rRNA pseudouridine955/2504/2580 synthase